MSKKQFRTLIGLWIVIFGCRFLPWPSQIPPSVAITFDQSLAKTMESLLMSGIMILFLAHPVFAYFWDPMYQRKEMRIR